MPSPVPRHLRTSAEEASIPVKLRDHQNGLLVKMVSRLSASKHPAKYAEGLPTALVAWAGTDDVADPMAGSGRLAEETKLSIPLNEPDPRWQPHLAALPGCRVSCADARRLPPWFRCDTMIFSPPYYPRTDRRVLAAHRGEPVGYRSGYGAEGVQGFIGDPAGADGILSYRNAMREVYAGLFGRARRMIVVVKNQTRLGVELRLDLDTALTAMEAGWRFTRRTGWHPKPSLWARYNLSRGTGIAIEDVLMFEAPVGQGIRSTR